MSYNNIIALNKIYSKSKGLNLTKKGNKIYSKSMKIHTLI